MSAKKRPGLGKGLEALIPGSEGPDTSRESGARQVSVESITPNPRQPRSRFDRSELVELAASIQEVGIIQPLIVTKGEEPGQYVLIAGERRLQASKLAGLTSVPVLVREATEQQLLELALVENVQRADLNPVETAVAYRQLNEDFNMSHDEIARQVGKSRVAVSNKLRLLKAPMPVLQSMVDRKISEGHARALLALPNEAAQEAMLNRILRNNFSVRQVEEAVRKSLEPKTPPKPKSPEVTALENDLREKLGTRVSLNYKEGRGTLIVHYYTDEQLNSLIDQLLEK